MGLDEEEDTGSSHFFTGTVGGRRSLLCGSSLEDEQKKRIENVGWGNDTSKLTKM